MKPNKLKKAFGVFKELFLNPGLPETYRNLELWSEQEGYAGLARECSTAQNELEETEAEFNRLCIGPYRLIVIPYESAWVSQTKKINDHVTADVADFYAAAGLSSASQLNEFPDFFGNELEFIYFLYELKDETEKKGNSEKLLRDIQGLADSFRVEHLDKWYEAFLESLSQNSNSNFWKEAAHVLLTLLQDSKRADFAQFPKDLS